MLVTALLWAAPPVKEILHEQFHTCSNKALMASHHVALTVTFQALTYLSS